LGIETHDSAQYRYLRGQLQHAKKPQQIRGLKQNHNHEMKKIFKGVATRASCGVGRMREIVVCVKENQQSAISVESKWRSLKHRSHKRTRRNAILATVAYRNLPTSRIFPVS
jgi:hypothetical protein